MQKFKLGRCVAPHRFLTTKVVRPQASSERVAVEAAQDLNPRSAVQTFLQKLHADRNLDDAFRYWNEHASALLLERPPAGNRHVWIRSMEYALSGLRTVRGHSEFVSVARTLADRLDAIRERNQTAKEPHTFLQTSSEDAALLVQILAQNGSLSDALEMMRDKYMPRWKRELEDGNKEEVEDLVKEHLAFCNRILRTLMADPRRKFPFEDVNRFYADFMAEYTGIPLDWETMGEPKSNVQENLPESTLLTLIKACPATMGAPSSSTIPKDVMREATQRLRKLYARFRPCMTAECYAELIVSLLQLSSVHNFPTAAAYFENMKQDGVRPHRSAYTALVQAGCGRNPWRTQNLKFARNKAVQVYAEMLENLVESDDATDCAVLRLHLSDGNHDGADSVMERWLGRHNLLDKEKLAADPNMLLERQAPPLVIHGAFYYFFHAKKRPAFALAIANAAVGNDVPLNDRIYQILVKDAIESKRSGDLLVEYFRQWSSVDAMSAPRTTNASGPPRSSSTTFYRQLNLAIQHVAKTSEQPAKELCALQTVLDVYCEAMFGSSKSSTSQLLPQHPPQPQWTAIQEHHHVVCKFMEAFLRCGEPARAYYLYATYLEPLPVSLRKGKPLAVVRALKTKLSAEQEEPSQEQVPKEFVERLQQWTDQQ